MKEVWKDVKGFEETHLVSNTGAIRVKDRQVCRTTTYAGKEVTHTYTRKGKLLKPTYSLDGYLQVSIGNTTYKVHRWVAQTFLTNPENKPQVNHIDGVKDNNLVSNLEWCTPRENVIHSYKLGLACNKGERHPRSILDENKVKLIRQLHSGGTTTKGLALRFGVCYSTIHKVITGKHWEHVK